MSTLEKEMTFGEAIREAIAEELRRDPTVFVMGEDVGRAGTVFKVLTGLYDEFGPDRIIDTPIAEAGLVGLGVGAALTGMRPIVDLMFGDFVTLAMDQIVNQAAKLCYMSGGQASVPITIRTTLGAGRSSAAQHSQSLHAWLAHIPGLKIVIPSTPADAKGLFKSAVRDNNPVVIYEDKMMYTLKGMVPVDDDFTIPFGLADVKREGDDVTLIATSSMVHVALEAAKHLGELGISAEVVDPRTLVPLDRDTLIQSVIKTTRAVIIDEGHRGYGITGELASVVYQGAFDYIDAPIVRLGAMDVPVPFSKPLEDATIPTAKDVIRAVQEMKIR
ncbi:MAG: alpha-ketoacid dehydrogenase subunit beta [bacterium]|nr:alpha-ketoacid dehydrogenase subunit beta [bacterium]